MFDIHEKRRRGKEKTLGRIISMKMVDIHDK
jgi:hypothetical protein